MSEKTSGPLSWDRTDAMHAMRCDAMRWGGRSGGGDEWTKGDQSDESGEGLEQGTGRGRKGDETDPTKLPTAQAMLSLRRGTVRAGCLELHHPIRSPAAAPARDRLIPLRSTADILDSSARTCSP